jgi:hypothetical protein
MSLQKNLIQALLVAFVVFLIFTVADKFGGFWAGVLGSIPIFLPIALFLTQSDTCNYSYMLMVSLGVYLVAAIIFVFLYHNNVIGRWQAMALAMAFWFVAVVPLFLYLNKKPPALLNDCIERFAEQGASLAN